MIQKNESFTLNDTTIIPIEVDHNRLKIFGFRIKDFTYLTDVKRVSDAEVEKIKGSKVMVVNALREEPHQSHFNLEEALAFVERVQPEVTYLTHISHLLGFHEEVEKKLPKNVHLAYDNLIITV